MLKSILNLTRRKPFHRVLLWTNYWPSQKVAPDKFSNRTIKYYYDDIFNNKKRYSVIPLFEEVKKVLRSLNTNKARSSHLRCSVKKGVLRDFAKFTGKHLCQRLFFNKVKKRSLTHVFSCQFCEISKNTFFIEHFRTTASVRRLKWVKFLQNFLKKLQLCQLIHWINLQISRLNCLYFQKNVKL